MIVISEWLPDPEGKDTEGEWIELWNSGPETVNLSGWHLENSNHKTFSLSRYSVRAHEYLLLTREDSKLPLRNRDEALFLYNEKGDVVHHAVLKGQSEEGQSLAWANGRFTLAEPTPGGPNRLLQSARIVDTAYPFGSALRAPTSLLDVSGMALGVGILVSCAILVMVKQHEYLSQLFFPGNEGIR